MTRMTGPDCAVMCNLTNTHTHTHTVCTDFSDTLQLVQTCSTPERACDGVLVCTAVQPVVVVFCL